MIYGPFMGKWTSDFFMDGNLDLSVCVFFSSKMYNSTGKARYPHSRTELSFVF